MIRCSLGYFFLENRSSSFPFQWSLNFRPCSTYHSGTSPTEILVQLSPPWWLVHHSPLREHTIMSYKTAHLFRANQCYTFCSQIMTVIFLIFIHLELYWCVPAASRVTIYIRELEALKKPVQICMIAEMARKRKQSLNYEYCWQHFIQPVQNRMKWRLVMRKGTVFLSCHHTAKQHLYIGGSVP